MIDVTKPCPKCTGTSALLTPMKNPDARMVVYGCKACGYTFRADGGAYVKDTKELKDVFRGATLANRALTEAMAGEKLNPATRVLLQAMLVEYGVQMWYDGLKQGLLLGAIQNEKGGGVPVGEQSN